MHLRASCRNTAADLPWQYLWHSAESRTAQLWMPAAQEIGGQPCRAGATEAEQSGKRIAEALSEGAVEGAEPKSAPAAAEKTDAWKSVEQASTEQASASNPSPATQPASSGVQQARVRELFVKAASAAAGLVLNHARPDHVCLLACYVKPQRHGTSFVASHFRLY